MSNYVFKISLWTRYLTKPFVGIYPNLQSKCSWGQRWIEYILRSKGKRSKYSEVFWGKYTNRWFAVEGHLVIFDVVSKSKLATYQLLNSCSVFAQCMMAW